jgi:hypothetical protein
MAYRTSNQAWKKGFDAGKKGKSRGKAVSLQVLTGPEVPVG